MKYFTFLFLASLIGMISSSCNNQNESSPIIIVPRLNKSMSLHVFQDFGDSVNFYLPIENDLKNLLHETGFDIKDSNNTQFDYKIIIKIKGEAVSGLYEGEHGYTGSYEGATIDGSLTLFDSLETIIEDISFAYTINPNPVIFDGPEVKSDPSEAPFELAFNNSGFFYKLSDMLYKNFGTDSQIYYWCSILKSKYSSEINLYGLNENAINILGDLKDTRTVVPLINNCENSAIILKSAIAISKIGSSAIPILIDYNNRIKLKKSKDIHFDGYSNQTEKSAILYALGNIGDKTVLPILIKELHSKSDLVRKWAVFSIFALSDYPNNYNSIGTAYNYSISKSISLGCQEMYFKLQEITDNDLGNKDKWIVWCQGSISYSDAKQ